MTIEVHASQNAPSPVGQGLFAAMTLIDGKGFFREGVSYIGPHIPVTESYVAAARASGLTATSTTVGGSRSLAETTIFIEKTTAAIASRPDVFIAVTSGKDLLKAKRSGRMGVIYDIQGTTELGGDASRVATLAQLGVRVFQLTYNRAALTGDGCTEKRNAGLTDFGRDVIAAVETGRGLLDLSHAGRQTTKEAIAAARRPCAITHAGCNALTPHPRNVDDAEIRAIAEKGGVFGLYFMCYLRKVGQSDREDLIAHIEHALKVAGEDHVSIGTDNDVAPLVLDEAFREYWRAEVVEPRIRAGIAAPNEGPDIFNYIPEYNSANRLMLLGHDLIKRGHTTARVEKILGGNLARLYTEVWG